MPNSESSASSEEDGQNKSFPPNSQSSNEEDIIESNPPVASTIQSTLPMFSCPPTLYPNFKRKKVAMEYIVGNNSTDVLEYGDLKPKEVAFSESNPVGNLKKRSRPYCRQTEAHACMCFENRSNEMLERLMGLRYLKAGSICLCYVCNDDSKYALSNPAEIALEIPKRVHDENLRLLSGFLSSNPVNRFSPDNEFFHKFTGTPYNSLSASIFCASCICSFRDGERILLTLLSLYSIISRFDKNILLEKIFLLKPLNFSSFDVRNTELWSDRQVYVFMVYYLVQHPEFCLVAMNENMEESLFKLWNRVLKETKIWKSNNKITSTISPIIFFPEMDDNVAVDFLEYI